jgi:ABC-2 type transport system permease protein
MNFFLYLLKVSIRASTGQRAAFLMECVLMILNNLVFVALWWIFFQQFQEIAGWTMHDMIVLNIVGLGGYGLMRICFGGSVQLSKTILEGGLDLFMTQPKNLLLHLLGSKSFPKGWGHLMTAAILILLGKVYRELPLLIIGMIVGALVFTSIGVIAHSLVVWLGRIEGVSKKYCESLYLFAFYPTNIYGGLLQVVMFTLIPAGVITYLPVELVRAFSWQKLVILLSATTSFVLLAFGIFYLGLRRYESGNHFNFKI